MAYTRHGYHIPGTLKDEQEPTPRDCGGPGICDSCTREAGRANKLVPADRIDKPNKPIVIGPDGKVSIDQRKPPIKPLNDLSDQPDKPVTPGEIDIPVNPRKPENPGKQKEN